MNIRRQHVMIWWLLTVVVMVIHGQRSEEEKPPQRRYHHSREESNSEAMDEFDHYIENELIERYSNKYDNRPFPSRPQHSDRPPMPSRMDKINRMGEELKVRMQQTLNTDRLRSILSSFGAEGYSEANGCCEGLDFNTFLPGFVLVAVSYMLFFLLNATVTSGRRKRMIATSKEEEESKCFVFITLFSYIRLSILY